VNFVIVKASVYISAWFVLDLEITKGQPTQLDLSFHVEVGVSVKIFWFIHVRSFWRKKSFSLSTLCEIDITKHPHVDSLSLFCDHSLAHHYPNWAQVDT
jgi:hypothetical protein